MTNLKIFWGRLKLKGIICKILGHKPNPMYKTNPYTNGCGRCQQQYPIK